VTEPVIIVGAGIAGLWAALNLSPRPVILLTGAPLGTGAATGWAQGGIAVPDGPGDSVEAHIDDTILAGTGLCDPNVARLLSEGIASEIDALRSLGVRFECGPEGRLSLGLEAAHTHPRIAHVRGDQAGVEILSVLVKAARQSEHIDIREGWRALSLLPAIDGSCAGVLAGDGRGNIHPIASAHTLLATGGYGGLYAHTTSPPSATGSAIAMAHRLGADIANPEFVQFHPTAIRTGEDPLPLATEALRGRGARLIDAAGNSITNGQDLASRDVVARAVYRAGNDGRGAYLDCRDVVGHGFADTFPAVFAACMRAGIDPRQTPIPVVPAAHYTMGGIATDCDGHSSIPGLWAVGECACNGLHGANRLASNSLAEGLVFARRAAEAIAVSSARPKAHRPVAAPPVMPTIALHGLRLAMSQLAGVEKDECGLRDLQTRIKRLAARFGGTNQIVAARLVAEAALERQESRGAHYRLDFQQPLPHAENTLIAGSVQSELVAAE
jgi:L-aspartate oxidase